MNGAIFLILAAASLLVDRTVEPRRSGFRQWEGMILHLLTFAVLAGAWLALTGSPPLAAGLAFGLVALLAKASNSKRTMLGEPLVFSDLALLSAVFRHPQFYFTALSARDRLAMAAGGVAAVVVLALSWVPDPLPHLWGYAILVVSVAALAALLRRRLVERLAPAPRLEADVARYGLIATLLLYWRRWRATPDPAPRPTLDHPLHAAAKESTAPNVIVIVQCESFADPVELTGDPAQSLPGLSRARAAAWQRGNLRVSGFGAYTMRTEYGVLFGRSEEEMGFRRYDPFLTARGETSYALSSQLSALGYRCLFVHPHDMRFYGRDRLMPSIGFALVGEERFDEAARLDSRYVNDRALGAAIGELVEESQGPLLIYAVTMENHGPWDSSKLEGAPSGLDAYLSHVRSSDAMLAGLIEQLSGRSALLAFFGDHRPSIPGFTSPDGERHTPYVMLRLAADGVCDACGDERDLTPDELHHAILRCALGSA